jgi:hypothetical protein
MAALRQRGLAKRNPPLGCSGAAVGGLRFVAVDQEGICHAPIGTTCIPSITRFTATA